MGEVEEDIVKQAVRSGQPIPDKILDSPVLQDGLQLYYTAFFELDTERNHSMGPMPIPFTSIVKYAELFELDERQTEDLLYYIREMDKVQLEVVKKAQSTGGKNGKNVARPS